MINVIASIQRGKQNLLSLLKPGMEFLLRSCAFAVKSFFCFLLQQSSVRIISFPSIDFAF